MMTKPEFVALAMFLLRNEGIASPSGAWIDRAWGEFAERQVFGDVESTAGMLNAVALSLNNTARLVGAYVKVNPRVC